MGSVKIQLQTDELMWNYVNLSTLKSIRGLIKYRNKFKYKITYNKMLNVFDMYKRENNFEILTLYLWLDKMIKKCTFSRKQKIILYYYYLEGLKEKEIAQILEDDEKNIKGIINSICKKILKQVRLNYKLDYLYWNKVKVETWKKCFKCKRKLPLTDEFFYKKNDNKDGFHNECVSCMKS